MNPSSHPLHTHPRTLTYNLNLPSPVLSQAQLPRLHRIFDYCFVFCIMAPHIPASDKYWAKIDAGLSLRFILDLAASR